MSNAKWHLLWTKCILRFANIWPELIKVCCVRVTWPYRGLGGSLEPWTPYIVGSFSNQRLLLRCHGDNLVLKSARRQRPVVLMGTDVPSVCFCRVMEAQAPTHACERTSAWNAWTHVHTVPLQIKRGIEAFLFMCVCAPVFVCVFGHCY